MVDTPPSMIVYNDELTRTFEVQQSLVRHTVTTKAMINGLTATFLVSGSGNATPKNRGVNGQIPARANDNTQVAVTLKEYHDLAELTGFNIFQSQGDQRQLMHETTVEVINRGIDQNIISALSAGTVNTGSAVTASLSLVAKAKTILGNNKVPMDGNITGLITPAFHGYLMQTKEFGSGDYVSNRPFENAPESFRWYGVNFIVHPELPGAGTANETCFFYHKRAIGHALGSQGIEAVWGYEARQDFSWARAKVYMESKLLQNSGVVLVAHNASEFAPAA